jgi:hypothetical protein
MSGQARAIDVYCNVLNLDHDIGNGMRLGDDHMILFATVRRDKQLLTLIRLMRKFTRKDFKDREETYERIIARIALAGT